MSAQIACFVGVGQPMELREIPLPELAPGELLVRVERAAICGSDLHTVSGRRQEHIPSTLGHEGYGRIVASARAGWLPGTRVTWTLVDSCFACPMCTEHALPQKCERLWKYGHGEDGLDGTYATHVRLRAGTNVFEVPEGLDPNLAAPANCVVATAVEALRGAPLPGRALVLGGGLLGLCCALILQERGWQVRLVDAAADRREAAEACGFAVAAAPEGACDLVVEAVGHPAPLHASYPLLRIGGEIRLVGLTNPNAALDLTAEQIIRRLWTLRGTHNYRPDSLAEALATLARLQSTLPLAPWWGPALPLAEIEEALALADSRKFLRVFLAP